MGLTSQKVTMPTSQWMSGNLSTHCSRSLCCALKLWIWVLSGWGRWLCRQVHANGGLSGGSRMSGPRSEVPHQHEQIQSLFFLAPWLLKFDIYIKYQNPRRLYHRTRILGQQAAPYSSCSLRSHRTEDTHTASLHHPLCHFITHFVTGQAFNIDIIMQLANLFAAIRGAYCSAMFKALRLF